MMFSKKEKVAAGAALIGSLVCAGVVIYRAISDDGIDAASGCLAGLSLAPPVSFCVYLLISRVRANQQAQRDAALLEGNREPAWDFFNQGERAQADIPPWNPGFLDPLSGEVVVAKPQVPVENRHPSDGFCDPLSGEVIRCQS